MLSLLKKILNSFFMPQEQKITYSERDIETIRTQAQCITDIINESLQIANESKNIETKLSRLNVATQKLNELKELARDYPFIIITSLDEVELAIASMSFEFTMKGYKSIADGNMHGSTLEKSGMIDEAIAQYENLLERKVDTPFTYRRLAILYKKRKQSEDELRAIRAALKNVPKSNAAHYAWFQERPIKAWGTLIEK